MSYCIECEGGSCPKHATKAQGEGELDDILMRLKDCAKHDDKDHVPFGERCITRWQAKTLIEAEISKQRELAVLEFLKSDRYQIHLQIARQQAQQELLNELEVHMGMVGHQHVSFDTPDTETERELSEFIQAKRLNLTKGGE